MPGSNPLFGLNALGGALSVQTKTGATHPGHAASVFAGSFGRVWTDLSSGGRIGQGGRLSYFAARAAARRRRVARLLRVAHQAVLRQHRVAGRCHDGSARRSRPAANRLIGNGAAPVQLLDEDRAAIFTHPDETRTSLGLFTLLGTSHGPPRFPARPHRLVPARHGPHAQRRRHRRTSRATTMMSTTCCVSRETTTRFTTSSDRSCPCPPTAYDGTSNTSEDEHPGLGHRPAGDAVEPSRRARANSLIAGGSFDGAGSRLRGGHRAGQAGRHARRAKVSAFSTRTHRFA